MRVLHSNATVCYLKKDNKILMIKFKNKWHEVYAPPGGKFESGESPLDCIIREFKEETNLELINPRLQGISYWHDSEEGIIFVFVADQYQGKLKRESEEGTLEWVDNLDSIEEFPQNKVFRSYLFQDNLFEGKFLLDDNCNVIDHNIRLL